MGGAHLHLNSAPEPGSGSGSAGRDPKPPHVLGIGRFGTRKPSDYREFCKKKHPMNKEKELLGPSRQGFPLEGCAPSRLPSPLLHWNVFKTGIPHWNVFKTHLNPKDGFNQAPSCRRSSALLISPKRTGISLRTGYFQLGVRKTSWQVHTTPLQAPGNPLAPDPDGKDGTGQVCSKSIQSKKSHQR